MGYIIYKNSRIPGEASYSGATWDRAELKHLYEEVYQDGVWALALADKLTEANPGVGFSVFDLETRKDIRL